MNDITSFPARPVGEHLRTWRQRRRMSQLDLAMEAEISTRHLSFVETGRAQPSRDMLLHLAERLAIPLRERNALLVAAGFAPVFPERRLDDPALRAARAAIELVLKGHEPYPALAVDRAWTLVVANGAVAPLLAGVDGSLLVPPVNVLRLSLHPLGLAPRIANFPEWREHVLARLRHQVELTADAGLTMLEEELRGYPAPRRSPPAPPIPEGGFMVVPLQIETPEGRLALFSTTTVFGTPVDVTLSELAIEAFYPADAKTAERLRRLGGAG
jgi:transcriptional regulator with XRE-family HTH domain